MTKDEANVEFEQLNIQERKLVIGTLNKTKHGYLVSGGNVDVPYFFWSLNKPLFEGVNPSEFLDIKTSEQFGIQAIYYISKYINKMRK